MAALPWVCPACRGSLRSGPQSFSCEACRTSYPIVLGVPDFRLQRFCDFDLAQDRARVTTFLGDAPGIDAATLVRRVFGQREAVPRDFVELRTRDVLEAPSRLVQDFGGWLAGYVAADAPMLDLGCGPGQLLAAAARRGQPAIGIDISLEWLVVARQLVNEHGGSPLLAAACGEALPLADGSLGSIVGLDVIEHVTDARLVVRETERTLRPGGRLVMTTPNRYSLTPEPHVFLWGVGWLPHRWQAPYVRWRSGKPYEHVRLRSSWGLVRLFRQNSGLRARIVIPAVAPDDARGSVRRRWLIDLYNRLVAMPLLRPLFLLHGPLFRVTARNETARP